MKKYVVPQIIYLTVSGEDILNTSPSAPTSFEKLTGINDQGGVGLSFDW